MYISFYITDSKNGLIFQYLPSDDAPSFKNLWTRIQSTCPQLTITREQGGTSEYKEEDENIKNLWHSLVGKDLEVFKYFSTTNNLYYWCLVSQHSNPSDSIGLNMEPYVIMGQIDQLILEYFDKDKITVKKIINNYDQITLIFNCLIDAGEPMVAGMYMNRVKSIIPMKSDFSKVINSTAHTIQNAVARHQYPSNIGPSGSRLNPADRRMGNASNVSPFTKDNEVVPWRNNKVTNDRNEFYLDVNETMSLVMEKPKRNKTRNGRWSNSSRFQLVNGKIVGTFDSRSYLGGNPLINVDLNNCGYDLGLPALHDCVELDHFDSKNTTLSFIPPNGRFRLMQYNLNLNRGSDGNKNWNQLGLVTVDYVSNLGIKEDEFEITLNISSSRKVPHISGLSLELQFKNAGNKSENEHDSKIDTNSHYKIRILRSTHGRFTQVSDKETGHWIFDPEVSTGTTAILRGCLEFQGEDNDEEDVSEEESSSKENIQESFNKKIKKVDYELNRVVIKYGFEGETLSGIGVNSIKVDTSSSTVMGINTNNNSKTAFKGVKYRSSVQAAELRHY